MMRCFIQNILKIVPLLTMLVAFALHAYPSEPDSVLLQNEMRVYGLISQMHIRNRDSTNIRYNDTVRSIVSQMVMDDKALKHPFDSLRKVMSILDAPDKSFRIINWATPFSDGSFYYYAYIISRGSGAPNKVFALHDFSDSIADPLKQVLHKNNWYGCLYYDLLHHTHNKRNIYTLLGWDGMDLFTNQKIVEILSFSSAGEPVFGKNTFTGPFSKYKRIQLQYSEKSSMTLNYNREKEIIVFDHLSPSKPNYTGHYEYYGADFSYDALLFEDGKWKYMPDIDIRLDKPKKKKNKP